MEMSKPSKAMIDAIRKTEDVDGSAVRETAIMGVRPDEGESGKASLGLFVLNGRGEVTVFPFASAHAVTEFCTGLKLSSDAVFADGDQQPLLVLDD